MGFKEVIQNAINIGSESKFYVQIGNDEIDELNYIQLGSYLVSNVENIKFVKIVIKDD